LIGCPDESRRGDSPRAVCVAGLRRLVSVAAPPGDRQRRARLVAPEWRATIGLVWFATYTDELDTSRSIIQQPAWEAGVSYLKTLGEAGLRGDVRYFRAAAAGSGGRVASAADGWVAAVGVQLWFGRSP
jgi:hypothetical protein